MATRRQKPPRADNPRPGFVALSSLKQGPPSTGDALADIRRIYFTTTAKTIEHDMAHAIELLKGLGTEEAREKASVFMEGLAELRKEWYRPTKALSGGTAKSKVPPGRDRGTARPTASKRR